MRSTDKKYLFVPLECTSKVQRRVHERDSEHIMRHDMS